jgi:hypothetical protein
MRKILLLLLIIIPVVVLNALLVGILIQTSDNNVDRASPRVLVSVIESNPSLSQSNEKLKIIRVQENLTSSTFKILVSNNYPSNITINSILINCYPAELDDQPTVFPANSEIELLFTFSSGLMFGHTYEIRILALEGYYANYFKTIC